MSSNFTARKQAILNELEVPQANYSDSSPKGTIDEGIRQLVNDINLLDGFVTTSSCAGRITVYQDGCRKAVKGSSTGSNPSGGKGGGKWLFVSHEPIDLSEVTQPGAFNMLFSLPTGGPSWPSPGEPAQAFVHLKFEPLRALSAAMAAGFRESGIGNIVNANGTESSPLVAVRSAGLAFDSIIAYMDEDGHIQPMVAEDYIRTLVAVANERFTINEQRKERFWQALRANSGATNGTASDVASAHKQNDWEPADVRKARKRAEGLERQKQLKNAAPASPYTSHHGNSEDEPISEQAVLVEDGGDISLRRSSFISENARALFGDEDFIFLPP